MKIEIKEYTEGDVCEAVKIWNGVVLAGNAFPQHEPLTKESGDEFFKSQSFTGIAYDEDKKAAGLYILHPNNVGRCAHICNASYAVEQEFRGFGVGESLVRHCMKKAKELGFRILQFNAVVKSNKAALSLYKKLGFIQLGTIRGGFCLDNGEYEDIIPHYIEL